MMGQGKDWVTTPLLPSSLAGQYVDKMGQFSKYPTGGHHAY